MQNYPPACYTPLIRKVFSPEKGLDHMSKLSQISELRYYVLGIATAPLFMAFFGSAWWGFGSDGVQTALSGGNIVFFVVLGIAVVVLLSGSVLLIQSALRLPRDTSPEAKAYGMAQGRRYGKWFGIVFGLEIVIISIGNIILYIAHHAEFVTPFMAIVVGLHFLPLAPLFHIRLYYLTGTLMVLVGLVVMLAVPVTMMVGQGRAWDVFISVPCALLLWLTGVYTIFLGRNSLAKAQRMTLALA
jgi:hypothetical protein